MADSTNPFGEDGGENEQKEEIKNDESLPEPAETSPSEPAQPPAPTGSNSDESKVDNPKQNNFPPLCCCPCLNPCFYQDIEKEIDFLIRPTLRFALFFLIGNLTHLFI